MSESKFNPLPSAPSEEEMGKIQKQIINLLDHLAEEHGTETFVSSGYGYYEDAADEFFALAVDLMSRTSQSNLQTESEITSSPESLKRFDDGLIRQLQRAQAASDKIKDEGIKELEKIHNKDREQIEQVNKALVIAQERIQELEAGLQSAGVEIDRYMKERDEARMKANELGDMIVQLKKQLSKAKEALQDIEHPHDDIDEPYAERRARQALKEIGGDE